MIQRFPCSTPFGPGSRGEAAWLLIVIVDEKRESNAIDSRSFSFEAGGRGTQSRWRNHSSPSTPTATDTGRPPIAASICFVHPVGEPTTCGDGRGAASAFVGANAAAEIQATKNRMSRRARITRPMVAARP